MGVITISRGIGIQADAIALRTAGTLGYHVVDRSLITDVARTLHYVEGEVTRLDEDGHVGRRIIRRALQRHRDHDGQIDQLRVDLAQYLGYVGGDPGAHQDPGPAVLGEPETGHDGDHPHPLDRETYFGVLSTLIGEIAAHGDVIILGRGAGCLLRGDPAVLRVRLTGSEAFRIDTLMMQDRTLSSAAARAAIHRSDERRAAFVRHHYHVDWADAGLYHLMVNVEDAGIELAADLIVTGLNSLRERWASRQGRATATT